MSKNYRDYIFSHTDDNQRQQIQFRALRDGVNKILGQILDDYGLAQKLSTAQASHQTLQILQLGCGEGFYLHELAKILEARQLLSGATLKGIDSNPTVVAVADEYSRLSKPPRPYLSFFVHDLNRPFDECLGLLSEGKYRFDLIFALQVTQHFPQPQQFIRRMYEALEPGELFIYGIWY